MNDPYKVLGVNPSDTDEQIKEAYRNLAKKYHPDNYADSPLADLAQEKMQEVNAAYDEIMEKRRMSGTSGTSNHTAGNGGQQYTSSSFADIRRMLQENRLVEAEELLNGTPLQNRDAEWYFLKGSVFYSRGWLDDAATFFSTACRMNPSNPEYRTALNRMMWQKQGNFGTPGNGQYRTNPNVGGCSACDMCSGLICADCCCECCGGDLVPCC